MFDNVTLKYLDIGFSESVFSNVNVFLQTLILNIYILILGQLMGFVCFKSISFGDYCVSCLFI